MYFCSRQVCFKELKIKLILPNLKHGAQRSHSEACSLKKCTLPYIYFVFKCLVLYFGIKKEWLEKNLNTFSLAANILKSEISSFNFFSVTVQVGLCQTQKTVHILHYLDFIIFFSFLTKMKIFWRILNSGRWE